MKKQTAAFMRLIGAMGIFGTIGIFVRYIPLPSCVIALARGIIGSIFLLLVMLCTRKGINKDAIHKNLPLLLISGGCIGLNWVLLFESYRFTTVATATLCYYMAPLFVVIASPFLLKEKLTVKKSLCVLVALVGMVFVSGVLQTGIGSFAELRGVLLGLGAALLYASVVLMNTKIKNIGAYDKTVVQLAAAAAVMIPYCLLAERGTSLAISSTAWILLIIVGIVHTGFAYAMYFGAMQSIPAQTTAIFSYTDPIIAVILSATVLKEPFTVYTAIGAMLVLGAALISELPEKYK